MNSENIIETTGETVEEAIAAGLAQLGANPFEVMIEVIEEPTLAVYGMSARPARVRIERIAARANYTPTQISAPVIEPAPIVLPNATPISSYVEEAEETPARPIDRPREKAGGASGTSQRDSRPARDRGERRDRPPREGSRDASPAYMDIEAADDENADIPLLNESMEVPEAEWEEEATVGKVVVGEMLERMGIRASIIVRRAAAETGDTRIPWILDVTGGEPSRLIGRQGETLAALQYVARLITSRELQKRAEFIVDAGGFKARRARGLYGLAVRMADDAVQRKTTVIMEPMPPHERRIVHLALRQREDVSTKSVGEGSGRKVTIVPREDGE